MDLETHIKPPATIAVAMSGGVDSSLAAVLLKERGYRVIGLTMRIWDPAGEGPSRCCSPQAFADARAVCQQWDIHHYVVDVRRSFAEKVINPFVEAYLSGRTPNPCVMCNTEIKWQVLLRWARSAGAQALATGHYARIHCDGERGRFFLLRGLDQAKDQSYALWGLSQEALSRTIFPLGDLTKTQTRRLANKLGLKVADKRDSQEICFVPEDDYGQFIRERLTSRSENDATPWSQGPIVDKEGRVLGRHVGIPFYTIGQRRGLGLAVGRPLYVVDIDPDGNRLAVGPAEDLLGRDLWAENLNWISIESLKNPLRCTAQIRYAHRAAPMELFPWSEGIVHGVFLQPQRAITPGQSVVFYRDHEVLGGGLICRSPKLRAEGDGPAELSTRARRKN